MIDQIRSEALKLRTTRTTWAVAIGALALIAAIATASSLATTPGDPDPGRTAMTIAGAIQTVALVLGALAVTTELRHGTIAPTLLIRPARGAVLGAKLLVHAGAALVLGLVAYGTVAAVALPILSSRDVATGLDAGAVAGIVVGGAIGTALFASIGVGVGAVVRNQVGAIVGALGTLYAIEPALAAIPGVGDLISTYGFAGLSSGVADTISYDGGADPLAQGPAGLMLAGYALVLVLAGGALLRRRDVGG